MGPLDLVSPLDYRYGRPEIKRIFTEDARLRYVLKVEAALAKAHAALGTIPRKDAALIEKRATDGSVRVERVKAIEAEIRHDLMAMVKALAEAVGEPAGGWVHLGATSYDALDTATALQIRDGLDEVEGSLKRLLKALLSRSTEHKATVMLGRTHGQAAIPITFGHKLIVFAAEVGRHMARLAELRPRVEVGKMSGAVGTGAGFGEKSLKLQDEVMKGLGLGVEEAATQIVQRDRYVELFAWMANVATSIEKFGTEVRNLQRTEIAEVAERFDVKKQVGSSTMAQKRNPVISEQVSGLARLVRAHLTPMMESAVQWHERDLSNSAPERFLFPESFILTDWILVKTAEVFEGLEVDAARMRANLDSTGGSIMAESLLLALARKGMGRQEAHEHTRRLAMEADAERRTFSQKALADPTVTRLLGSKEITAALDPGSYLGDSVARVERLAKELSRWAK